MSGMLQAMLMGTSIPIVSSGLTMHLDAANSSSYSGSGQTWTDLMGNFNWFLGATSSSEASDPTFTGSAGSLSSSTYWAMNGSQTFTLSAANAGTLIRKIGRSDTPFTWEMWIWPGGTAAFDTYYSITAGGQAGGYLMVANATSGPPDLETAQSAPTYNDFTQAGGSHVGTGAWMQLGWAAKGDGTTTCRFFKNGSDVYTNTYSANFTTGDCSVVPGIGGTIGKYPNTSRIAIIRLYNRVLTSAEVSQNWQSQRGRFGL